MESNKQKKLGITIIDGKIIDLDKVSSKELEEYLKNMEEKEKKLEEKISNILGEDDFDNER